MTNQQPKPKGQYATVNGLDMYYEIHGSGEPLVILHGAFGSVAGWDAILPTLTANRQVILVEQQGHGHTADRDQPLFYEQMADDTAALLKYLQIPPADIFGYSDGGVVGFGIAIRHPERVRKLAVLGANTGKLEDAYDAEGVQQFQSLPADFAPPILVEPYKKMAPDPSRWPILVQKIKTLGLDFPGYSTADVAAITAPTLIIQGDRDHVRVEHSVEIFRLIPNAQLAVFPGADHFIPWTCPDKLLATLIPFLDQPIEGKG